MESCKLNICYNNFVWLGQISWSNELHQKFLIFIFRFEKRHPTKEGSPPLWVGPLDEWGKRWRWPPCFGRGHAGTCLDIIGSSNNNKPVPPGSSVSSARRIRQLLCRSFLRSKLCWERFSSLSPNPESALLQLWIW